MRRTLPLLWLISIACTVAGMPYAFELQRDVIASVTLPFPLIVLITVLQTAILLAGAVYVGAKAAGGIQLRIFAHRDMALNASATSRVNAIAKRAIPFGIGTAVAIFVTDELFVRTLTPQFSVQTADVTLWKTLLAAFYGGVVEEVLMRLFLVSVIAWALTKLLRSAQPVRNGALMWSAIAVAAVVFGLGHLPATAAMTAITGSVVVRAIVLNGIGGLVFGWLYWKRGLEYAIGAHFTADIFLLAVFPAIVT